MFTKPFLPDFCRRQWVSREARALWEPRIAAIGRQFAAAERASIEAGIRSAALQSIAPEELCELSARASQRGLVVVPLNTQGRTTDYAASPVPLGGAWEYRVAVTLPDKAAEFSTAWRRKDDDALGRLLGYPDCCRAFFRRTWGAGSVDPTFEMADCGDGPVEANILLRWLGVRYIPHLPCGFRCEGTLRLGGKFRALIPDPERSQMDELLSMPMRWSALHGIGEVVTPIVSLNFRTEFSHELREIRREGTSYPELGACGLQFPYRLKNKVEADPRQWTDNGFASPEAMERLHTVICSVLAPDETRTVLDLGCGNGILARRLAGPDGRAIGIERDGGRAARALERLDEVLYGDLHKVDFGTFDADVLLLMPGRLIERSSNGLLERLRSNKATCLVYAYGDWLRRYESLESLCGAAGMSGRLTRQKSAHDVSAGIWEWAP